MTDDGSEDSADGIERLGDGLVGIDTFTAGMSKVTAGFLLEAPRPTLIECGPALSIERVIDALRRVGLDAGDLAYLVVSHIHLDHAGGAGDVLAAFPGAKVVVSELGARHLVDPERLNASSRRVYGPLMDAVYGDCTPVADDRVIAVGDEAQLELGDGRLLDVFWTPGHAKHHIAALDSATGALFVGDSVGVKLPGMTAIRPATPPPDFDLDRALVTIDRYRALDPTTIYLAHYGAVDPPQAALDEARDQLRVWADTAEAAWREHDELDHIADTLARRFADDLASDEEIDQKRVALLSGFRSNAMGLRRYFSLREEGRL